MDVFTILIVVLDSGMVYISNHQSIYFKYLQFIVCQLYLNKDVFKKPPIGL